MNRTLINIAALCIIMATVYGGIKEAWSIVNAQQSARLAQIEEGQRIIDETLGGLE